MEKNNVDVDIGDMPMERSEYPTDAFNTIEGHGEPKDIDSLGHTFLCFCSGPAVDVISEYSPNWDILEKKQWLQKKDDQNYLIVNPETAKKEDEKKCGYRAYVTRPAVDGLFFNDKGNLEKACESPLGMLYLYRGIYGDMFFGPWNNGQSSSPESPDAVPVMKTRFVFNHAVVKEPLRALSSGLCTRFGVEYEKMKPMAPRTPWSLAIMLNACHQLEEYNKTNKTAFKSDNTPYMNVAISNTRMIKVESTPASQPELGVVCTCTPIAFPKIDFDLLSGCSPMAALFINTLGKVVPIPPLLVYQSPLLCALFENEKMELILDWKDILGNMISFIIYGSTHGRTRKGGEKRTNAALAKLYDKITIICKYMALNEEITADTLHAYAVRILHVAEKIVMGLLKIRHAENTELFSSPLRPIVSLVTDYKRFCIKARENEFIINAEIEHNITPPIAAYEWKNGEILAQKFLPVHGAAVERTRNIMGKKREFELSQKQESNPGNEKIELDKKAFEEREANYKPDEDHSNGEEEEKDAEEEEEEEKKEDEEDDVPELEETQPSEN
jgi:hypothetical protein